MNDFDRRCVACHRLLCERAPTGDYVLIRCSRSTCKTLNLVREGQAPREAEVVVINGREETFVKQGARLVPI